MVTAVVKYFVISFELALFIHVKVREFKIVPEVSVLVGLKGFVMSDCLETVIKYCHSF